MSNKTQLQTNNTKLSALIDALANVQGINVRMFTSTVSADATSGSPTIAAANDWIASIRSNSNAFVLVRYMGVAASTASLNLWFNANFKIAYRGTTAYNTASVRQTASQETTSHNVNGLTGENYSGHLCVASNGRLYCYPSTTYPLKAGTYQIIAGLIESL